ncbi:hypothetical protein [Ureibacillus endophyticus]|uniref:hypothetical protein n=1 Tax=Ureibacillus endophyticus TaxID=1978490 RepID=UPI001475106F|nr:hypothetical protein [Lysinibacillus endophyticus]
MNLSFSKMLLFGFFIVLMLVFFAVYSIVLTNNIMDEYYNDNVQYERYQIE